MPGRGGGGGGGAQVQHIIWPDLWDFQASGSPDFLEKIAKT